MRAKEISQRLAERAEDVVRYLLPNAKRASSEMKVGSVDGEAGQSLSVCISGNKKGVFSDFASGDSGDLLDLWSFSRKISLSEAILEAKQWLGITQVEITSPRSSNFVKPKPQFGMIALADAPDDSPDDSPVLKYLIEERKLELETLKRFRVKILNREIVFPFIRDDQLLQIKYLSIDRPNGKKQIRVEKNCQPSLFGWQAIDSKARTVVITEGELDCMTLSQYGFNALSLPFGGGSGAKHKWLEYDFDKLAMFDQIFLCLDNDEPGQIATREIIERLGRHRCLVVELPHKDANECLQKGVSKQDIQQCFDQAKSCDPDELRSATIYSKAVIDEFYPPEGHVLGYLPPWQKAQDKILFRPEELSIFCGTNGHGKSQMLGHIVLDSMKQGAKVCIASLEIKPKRLLMRLTRQAAALERPTEAYIKAIHEWYSDKLWLFDLVGTAKAERLLEVFLYAKQRYGIDVFVVDSFMKCGVAEDDYNKQKLFIEQLCDFKNENNCQIRLVVHPRKQIDESKAPSKLDMKGTGAVSDLADNCFTVWRNKHKESQVRQALSRGEQVPQELQDKPDCLLISDKNRNGEWEGKIALWFDKKSFQYLNHASQKPKPYVHFSTQLLNSRRENNE